MYKNQFLHSEHVIMSKSLRDKLSKLPKKRQSAIQNRTNELIAQERTLQDLKLTRENADLSNGQEGRAPLAPTLDCSN